MNNFVRVCSPQQNPRQAGPGHSPLQQRQPVYRATTAAYRARQAVADARVRTVQSAQEMRRENTHKSLVQFDTGDNVNTDGGARVEEHVIDVKAKVLSWQQIQEGFYTLPQELQNLKSLQQGASWPAPPSNIFHQYTNNQTPNHQLQHNPNISQQPSTPHIQNQQTQNQQTQNTPLDSPSSQTLTTTNQNTPPTQDCNSVESYSKPAIHTTNNVVAANFGQPPEPFQTDVYMEMYKPKAVHQPPLSQGFHDMVLSTSVCALMEAYGVLQTCVQDIISSRELDEVVQRLPVEKADKIAFWSEERCQKYNSKLAQEEEVAEQQHQSQQLACKDGDGFQSNGSKDQEAKQAWQQQQEDQQGVDNNRENLEVESGAIQRSNQHGSSSDKVQQMDCVGKNEDTQPSTAQNDASFVPDQSVQEDVYNRTRSSGNKAQQDSNYSLQQHEEKPVQSLSGQEGSNLGQMKRGASIVDRSQGLQDAIQLLLAGRKSEVLNSDVLNRCESSSGVDDNTNWYRFAEEVLDTCVLSVLEATLDGEGL